MNGIGQQALPMLALSLHQGHKSNNIDKIKLQRKIHIPTYIIYIHTHENYDVVEEKRRGGEQGWKDEKEGKRKVITK